MVLNINKRLLLETFCSAETILLIAVVGLCPCIIPTTPFKRSNDSVAAVHCAFAACRSRRNNEIFSSKAFFGISIG